MDDEKFIKGDYANSTVYNNPEDSDIILKCGDHQIYAHRAVLRMWSPFFERTFKSQFPIAKSPVFDIDSDDNEDHEPLCIVLKHIYGMPFEEHSKNTIYDSTNPKGLLDCCVKVYTMADKYDFLSVRQAVVSVISDYLEIDELSELEYDGLRFSLPELPELIARVCGPNAPHLADTAMRDSLFDWLVYNFGLAADDPGFKVKLEDGSLLDTDLIKKLPFKLSERIREYIRVRDARDDAEDSEDSEA